MPLKRGKRLPENCIQCGKAEAGTCPYHIVEGRHPQLPRMMVRGTRKIFHLDGLLPNGHSLPPNVVVLMPTANCNLSCSYCFQRSADGSQSPRLPEKHLNITEWLFIIDELKAWGLPFIVMGGELFLYPEILELLQAIKKADLPLTIITNGFNLSKFSSELVAMGLDQLIVSIDGPAIVHNQIRDHPKSYQLAVQGIKHMLAARGVCSGPSIQVSCTISTFTQTHLLDFVHTMCEIGVERIVFNNLIYATAEQVAAQAELLYTDFALEYNGRGLVNDAFSGVDPLIVKRELQAIRTGPWADRVFVSPPGVEQNLEAYYDPLAMPFQKQGCTAIHRELWLLPDGNVAACGHLPELVMGNVGRESPMAVWNGPRFRLFRQRLARGLLPACVRCEKLTYEHP